MRITFRKFIGHLELIKSMSFKEEEVVKEIYFFVEIRLKPLKEEIEQEEKLKDNVGVIIDYNEINFSLTFQEYSKELAEKSWRCFSKSDIIYLKRKIDENLNRFF